GRYDAIWISHLHPDHYDAIFLRHYLEHYPETVFLTGRPEVHAVLKRDGFLPSELHSTEPTRIGIFPHRGESEIDSVLVVERDGKSIVNMNDCPYSPDLIQAVLDFTNHRVTIAAMAYTGAGPYPHTYFEDREELRKASEEHKQFHAKRFRQ